MTKVCLWIDELAVLLDKLGWSYQADYSLLCEN